MRGAATTHWVQAELTKRQVQDNWAKRLEMLERLFKAQVKHSLEPVVKLAELRSMLQV
jgi:hypothetical protein